MSARADIARAASSVIGVNVTPNYRQVTKAGEGFVRWAGRDLAEDRFGYMDRWQVWLVVPQDLPAAEDWVADKAAALIAALDPELVVTSLTPADLVIGTATALNGLIIDGARPSDDD